MTLLINEIHVYGNLQNSFILQIADRRITRNGSFVGNHKKLIRIPYLNACVGYFGLAQINSKVYFSNWLSNFIVHSASITSLEAFSNQLCEKLNSVVDKTLLEKSVSGLHICGYNSKNLPEMWFVRNIEGMDGNTYKGIKKTYFVDEQFLKGPAREWGFDGINPVVNNNYINYYINGDVRPFHLIWRKLDEFVEPMLMDSNFERIKEIDDLAKIAKWKMRVISTFYQQFARKKIIGTPSDVFILQPINMQ